MPGSGRVGVNYVGVQDALPDLPIGWCIQIRSRVGDYVSFTIVSSFIGTGTGDGTREGDIPLGRKAVVLDRNIEFQIDQDETQYNIIYPVALQPGGAHNVIKRLRIMYGSMVLEDIQEYKTLTRILFESGVDPTYMATAGSVLDGTTKGRFNQG